MAPVGRIIPRSTLSGRPRQVDEGISRPLWTRVTCSAGHQVRAAMGTLKGILPSIALPQPSRVLDGDIISSWSRDCGDDVEEEEEALHFLHGGNSVSWNSVFIRYGGVDVDFTHIRDYFFFHVDD